MNNLESKGLSVAQELIRCVVRAFYETRDIIILDAVIRHSALRDDDLSYLMHMNLKDLHKACGRLREARLLNVQTQAEAKVGQQRANNRTYYYIDYRKAVDCIKWKVYQMTKSIQKPPVPASERKEFFCTRCGAEWTQLEVLDKCGPAGFLCHKCNAVLQHDPRRHAEGHEESSALNDQLKFITDRLQKIDALTVPVYDFEVAFKRRLPVTRSATHQVAETTVVDQLRPTAVKGLQNTGPKSVQVVISNADGPSEAEKEAERERKEKAAKQNALPSWIAQSTVSGEFFEGTINNTVGTMSTMIDEDEKPTHEASHAELNDVFARLKAEQEAARQTDEEMGEEDEEGDEDEFEDVI